MDENLTMSFEEQQRKRQEQMLIYGQEMRERQEELRRQQEQERKQGAAVFGRLAALSLLYTLIYTVCLYKNSSGITAPIWVMATVGYVTAVFRMFQIAKKRDSIFVMIVMGLLGVSNFLTGNEWIIWMNYIGIFLLLVAFVLHNFCDDRSWDFGKYFGEITMAVFGAIGFIGKPFTDGNAFFQSRKQESKGRGRYILFGICIAIPCVLFLGVLLATADMVFADMVQRMFSMFRFPAKVFGILFMLCFGFFSSYCGVRFIASHADKVTVTDRKTGEPLIAITVTFMIALLYGIFCAIQIAYLFIGKMRLPEGVTYAEYARSGFFQLLFVCILNLMLVLAVKKYFRESRLLNVLLLVISGCTLIMTASSALRMLLYIKAYHLTFLRVLVLVALFAIALLMAGVVAMIVKPGFLFFRYGIVVVSVVYLGFSFSHVDYFIASYNLAQVEKTAYMQEETKRDGRSQVDYGYIYTLSTDAAPAIAAYLQEHPGEGLTGDGTEMGYGWLDRYLDRNESEMNDITLRNFNVSHYTAQRLLGE